MPFRERHGHEFLFLRLSLSSTRWENPRAPGMAPHVPKGVPSVYLLRLASGAFYIGSTLNLSERMADHIAGIGCKTTVTTGRSHY